MRVYVVHDNRYCISQVLLVRYFTVRLYIYSIHSISCVKLSYIKSISNREIHSSYCVSYELVPRGRAQSPRPRQSVHHVTSEM